MQFDLIPDKWYHKLWFYPLIVGFILITSPKDAWEAWKFIRSK